MALIGVFQDFTARHAVEPALRLPATTDELTGLSNRAGFNAVLDERMARARAAGEPLALPLIDPDGLKLVNDRRGHLSTTRCCTASAAACPSRTGRAARPRGWAATSSCSRW